MNAEWKLVPVEPTPEMLLRTMPDVCNIGAGSCGEHVPLDWDDVRLVWSCMLAASPQPAAQPEPCMCKDRPKSECPGEWEPGCDLGANEKFVRKQEQPEPGVLTEAQALAIADKYGTRWTAPDEEGISFEKSAFFDFLSEVLATTRKRSDAEVARIMEAVNRLTVAVHEYDERPLLGQEAKVHEARAEVERLLRGAA